jgi:hypothetical protein
MKLLKKISIFGWGWSAIALEKNIQFGLGMKRDRSGKIFSFNSLTKTMKLLKKHLIWIGDEARSHLGKHSIGIGGGARSLLEKHSIGIGGGARSLLEKHSFWIGMECDRSLKIFPNNSLTKLMKLLKKYSIFDWDRARSLKKHSIWIGMECDRS